MGGQDAAHVVRGATVQEPVRGDAAWALLRALAWQASRGAPAGDGDGVWLDERGMLRRGASGDAWIVARPQSERGWDGHRQVSPDAEALLDLYAPLCVGPRAREVVLAHLGQSLDGRVSAAAAPSCFITGPEDVEHTHRLRALFDAVLIGAETAAIDDPRLTTRLVPGTQPARVVLDPHARLDHSLRVLSDREAQTVVVTGSGYAERYSTLADRVRLLELPLVEDRFSVPDLLAALRVLGLRRIFIEGGGVTVTRFLDAAGLDRLHLTIARRRVGAGAAGVPFVPSEDLSGLRSVRARRFALGGDVLFDCDLRQDVS